MSDILTHMGDDDTKKYNIVESIHKIMKSNHLVLETITEDTFLNNILEYVYDTITRDVDEIDVELSLGKVLSIDFDSMISDSIYSNSIYRILVEHIFFVNVFLCLDKNSIIDRKNISDIIQTMIDGSVISGSDIVHFINLDKAVDEVIDMLTIAYDNLKYSIGVVPDDMTVIPIGWNKLNHLVLIYLKTRGDGYDK